jgi:hypothetical protein
VAKTGGHSEDPELDPGASVARDDNLQLLSRSFFNELPVLHRERLFIGAQAASDGTLSAARVQVSKDGVKPPQ